MFLGRPNLRGDGEKYEFTNDTLAEYFKCAEDIVYFAERYFYITNIDDGKHKIKLFDFQKKALKVFTSQSINGKKNAIVLTPRQMGKCLFRDTKMTIRNKKTGEIKEIPIVDFYNSVNGIDDASNG